MSQLQRFFKDTLIYGFAAVLPKAINVLLVKLHTSSLTTSEYSVNTSFYVWAAYFNVVLTYGMETAFFRFFSKEQEKDKVVSTAFISLVTTSLISLSFMLYFDLEISNFLGFSNPFYFDVLVWISILDTLIVIPFAYLRVVGKSKKYTLFRVLNIGVYAFFNVLFLAWIPNSDFLQKLLGTLYTSYYNPNFKEGYIFCANLLASAITFLCVLPIIFKIQFTFSKRLLLKMGKYSWPIFVAGIAYTTNENLDKLLLENWLGKSIMGAYAGAYKIGVIMSLFVMAFRLGAEPFFFNQASQKNAPKTYAIILKWFVIIGALFTLGIIVYIDLIASLFLGDASFYTALSIVPVIVLANLFLGIYNNLSIWYKITDKTQYGMYFSVLGAFITIAMLYLLIPTIGYMGAAWATLAAYSTMLIVSFVIGQYKYPIPYKVGNSLFYIGLSIVLSTISFLKFQQNYICSTLCILVFIATITVKEKEEIKRMIRKKTT
ncbi:MAG: lipopolysaccharide biosynthesis protein [Flavicella sp.]